MSYDSFQRSPDSGGPITLYEFVVGPNPLTDILRYTDADEDVFHPGADGVPHRWSKEAIRRGDLKADGSLSKASMEINLPQENVIADLYTYYPPSYVVTVRVLEGHFADRDREFVTVFAGRVLNCEIEGIEATLTCEPGSTSMSRPGLRRNYQRQCPLVLYGPRCKAVRTALVCTAPTIVAGRLIGTPTGGIPVLGLTPFSGGEAHWANPETGRTEIRPILIAALEGVSQISFTLAGPIVDAPVTEFSVFKGCVHTETACVEWHNNRLNYGGQLWIPYKNPVGSIAVYF